MSKRHNWNSTSQRLLPTTIKTFDVKYILPKNTILANYFTLKHAGKKKMQAFEIQTNA